MQDVSGIYPWVENDLFNKLIIKFTILTAITGASVYAVK